MLINQLLLSAIPYKIQCSNEKRNNYKLNVIKYNAIDEYNFIQISHPKYYRFISIDIDSKQNIKTFEHIYLICKEKNIPYPTIIVETNRGWHVHWAFIELLWKNNKKLMIFRKKVFDYLNDVFNGDKHFSSFIVRNPLKHNYTYLDMQYTIDKWKHICNIDEININSSKTEKIFYGNKYFNFNSVKVGNRNNTLYRYLTQYGFVNFKSIDNERSLINEGLRINKQFAEPLEDYEVIAVAKSVYKFIVTNYNEKYVSKFTKEKNRLLAKQKKMKTIEKMFAAIKNKKVDFIKLLRNSYTYNKLAKLLGVSNKTAKKHYKKLIKFVLSLLNVVKYKFDIGASYIVTEIIKNINYRFTNLSIAPT